MAATSSTTYASTIRTKYLLDLLNTAAGKLVASRWANNKMIGKGEGNTVRVNRLLRVSKVTSASTAGTLITTSSAKALYSNYKDMNLEIWGDSFAINEDVDVTSFVSDKDNRDNIANQMYRSLEYQLIKKMSTQCFRHRIDKDANYSTSGTCTSTSSTTSLVGAFTATNDGYNGGYVTIINPDGANYDLTSAITDCTEASGVDTAAVSFPQALDATSKFHMTVGTGLATTDVMTTGALLDVSARHEVFETEKFNGGVYRMFMHASQHRDLWDDTTFINSIIYDSSEELGSYKVGRLFDIEFLISSELYREDVDGTENQSTGVVHVSPVFGKNSYSVFTFANPGGSGMFGVKFYIVDQPDSQNLRNSAKYISWKGMWAGGVTRSTSIIGLMTGATSLGVSIW